MQPPRTRGRGRLIAVAAVVVALAAGGIVTFIARSDTNTAGAATPQKAVESIVSDLNKSDLVGVLDDLPPGERDAIVNPVLDEIDQLKRLNVLQQGADPKNVSGVKFTAKSLTFSNTTVTINDHVRIVELTGGTLDIAANAAKVPFTKKFLDTVFPNGLPVQSNGTEHIDIAQQIQAAGGDPVRIAAQKVGGRWYPSIMYTIADAASQHAVPAGSDRIPAEGGSSPEDAVTRMVNALLHGDTTGAIKLLSPDELAVMHDYGGIVVRDTGYEPVDAVVKDLQLTTQKVSGGATRVLLRSVTVTSGGDEVTVKLDGDCVDVTSQGDHQRMCTADLISEMLDGLQGFGMSVKVSAAQKQAFAHLLGGLTKIGVDTTQSGGQWYVNPARSYLDVTTAVLSELKGNDLLELLGFFANLEPH